MQINLELIIRTVNQIFPAYAGEWSLADGIVTYHGNTIPLLYHRYDRRLREIRSLAVDARCIDKICSYKSLIIENADKNMDDILKRELDTAEWILDDRITSVYALAAEDKTLTAVLRTASGLLCLIDIALTLSPKSNPVTRHELVGTEGVILDRSINEQIPVDAVYMYCEDNQYPVSYTDADLSMFGLAPEEIMIADAVIDVLRSDSSGENENKRIVHLDHLADIVRKSAAAGEKYTIEETNGL